MDSLLKASRGFGCAIAIIVLSLGMNGCFRAAYRSEPAAGAWLRAHPYLASGLFHVLQGSVWVLVAYLLAGLRLKSFFRETGLAARLTFSGWLYAWGAILLGFLQLCFVAEGWSKENRSASSFYQGGFALLLPFLAQAVLLAPFVEETVVRGFLYRAFRGSYGIVPSTILALGFQTYFHWGLISQDPVASVLFLVGGAVLCVIRERTQNTWHCVLFHAAYNAIVLRQWPLCVIAMAITLGLSARAAPAKDPPHPKRGRSWVGS